MRVQFAMADGQSHETVGEAITRYWPIVAGIAGGGWLWLKERFRRRELSDHAKGEIITIAQNAATGMIAILEAEAARLRIRVDELEEVVREMGSMMASKDADFIMLRGRYRQAMATLQLYERLLSQHGIPHDPPAEPMWEIVGSDLKPTLGDLAMNGGPER